MQVADFRAGSRDAKSKIGELEIGRGLDFFHSNGAKLIEGPKLQCDANCYELTPGDSGPRLVERVEIHAPILIGLARGHTLYEARYLLWEGVAFQVDLFARPAGVKIEEGE